MYIKLTILFFMANIIRYPQYFFILFYLLKSKSLQKSLNHNMNKFIKVSPILENHRLIFLINR